MFKEFSLGCKGMSSSLIRKERIINQNDHSFSFVVTLVIPCYSLSFSVTPCLLFQHSLSLVLPLVAIRYTHPHCHSSSLVPLVVTRCHSLSLVVPLVLTGCHSLSLNVSFICLFTNDQKYLS